MRQKGFVPILVLLILVVLGLLGYVTFFFRSPSQQSTDGKKNFVPTMTPFTLPEQPSNETYLIAIYNEFKKINNNFKSVLSEPDKIGIWWISDDGLNIINDDTFSDIQLNIYDCDTESDTTYLDVLSALQPKIDEIMLKNGFQINRQNSSNTIQDDQFVDNIRAYEKGSVKAILKTMPECYSIGTDTNIHHSISFAITNGYENNYKLQAPFLKDLGIKDSVIRIDNRVGDFVYLNVNYRRAGHYTIAKMIDNRWTELYSGQDWPPCETIERYKIPEGIISNCY